jgi:RNA 2',3'-cyclic 3'-phosphodiesterase
MTLPPVIRVFFGINLPIATQQALTTTRLELENFYAHYPIRWSKANNLHITLQFLAQFKTADLNNLCRNVNSQLRPMATRFRISIEKLEFFPESKPHIIALNVEPQAQLRQLAQCIGRGIEQTHYPTEKRPFKGHLTLGRIKTNSNRTAFMQNKLPLEAHILTFSCNEIILFHSQPSPLGSIYTPLKNFPLA